MFVGTPDKLMPAQFNGSYPKPSLELGRLQPSPDGSDFDRDYAGGGPTYIARDLGEMGLAIFITASTGSFTLAAVSSTVAPAWRFHVTAATLSRRLARCWRRT